jgi:hypothetical protein
MGKQYNLRPFKQLAKEVCSHMGLSKEKLAIIKAHRVVHEDNSGALTLVELDPGISTPMSKFFKRKHPPLVQAGSNSKLDS